MQKEVGLMTKKRIWLFALAFAVLLAALIGFITLSGQKEGAYKGAKLVLCPVQDAFLHMPEGVA